VTTFEAAAAWQKLRPIAFALIAGCITVGVAGCETGASLFGSSSDAPSTALTDPSTSPTTRPARIAIAPVIGPPANVSKDLQTQLTSAIESQNIGVASGLDQNAEYTLRGYVVSAMEKKGKKARISYIWDVTDATGKGVHRVTGEVTAAAANSKNPWTAVTPKVVQEITSETVTSLAKWLPKQNQQPAPAVASSGSISSPPLVQTAAAPPPKPMAPPTTTGNSPAPPSTVTGSINRTGPVTTRVPTVTGAPGDGSNSLRVALQRELTRSGMKLTEAPSPSTYTVEGQVVMGTSKDGKQPITIDWNVKDPEGKKLGTVSQKNEVPQGSLDGAWGKTADAAAAAAAQGILKLLPKDQTASSN